MKNLLLISLVVSSLGLAASAMAQAAGPVGGAPQSSVGEGKRGGRGAAERMNAELLAKLNLTDDQKAKLKAHQDEMKTKTADLRAQAKAAKGDKAKQDALKEQTKALRKENTAFMKELLTKDQLKQLAKLRREAAQERKDKAGTTPPAPTKPGV